MNKKTKIIASSVLAIAMSASVATGATFALFTSESQVDVSISSGKVDVKAYAEYLRMYSPSTITDVNNVTATEDTNGTFKNGGTAAIEGNVVTVDRMTPGDKVTFELVVHNYSNVNVQYQTKLEVVEGYDLFSGLTVTFSGQDNSYDGMTAISNWATLPAQTESREVGRTMVTIELPADRGNEYQEKSCEIAFTVSAVQGNAATTNPDPNTTYLYNVSDLMVFAKNVSAGNTYANKTVLLMNDVNLAGYEWTPIDNTVASYPGHSFKGTFNGQNCTISNMTASSEEPIYAAAGFFGTLDEATVKNVTFVNANVTSTHYAGVVCGYTNGNTTIENCKVYNSTVTSKYEKIGSDWDNGDKVGGIIGYATTGSVVNGCYVEGTTIQGYRDIGGIIGYSTATITNCTTKNNTVLCDPTINYKGYTSFDAFDCEVFVGEGTYGEGCTDTGSVAKFTVEGIVFTAEQLVSALTADVENVKVVLANDIAVDISSLGTQIPGRGQYRLGGNSTQTIVIDLNGNKLTLNTTYMSALGAVNSSATATIKNGTMTSSSTSGTWNIYDLMFFDCDWVFDGVTFGKAVAINNAGKTVTMKDVTINETHDYYALWVCAGADIAMDGCSITSSGRAIKISDQYVGQSDRSVTKLSVKDTAFTSAKKAAILVGSTAGANITLDNVDISNVRADRINAVWVDNGNQTETGEAYSDYANRVTVLGGTAIVEP